ncbi:39S ribosomal protein L28, mitochondrial [Callorhinchus milii]|nr:39S ribosomal protein L28, mitochondrial [Callorhinchus milii]
MPLHRIAPRLWDARRLEGGIYARLPAHYLRALREARPPGPVHWRRPQADGRLPGRGAADAPVRVFHPPESQRGLWGGEGWVGGYRYVDNDKLAPRVKKIWKPQLFMRELSSEILDKTFTLTVTMRTLDLVDAAFGFDFYILKTSKEDLQSKLGIDLKRAMLLRLARKDTDLHPNDPVKRESIFNKYKAFAIPEEEAEWVGLSLEEAVEKQRVLEKKDPVPLFRVYAEELANKLVAKALTEPVTVSRKQ